jgi:hypothetical protein
MSEANISKKTSYIKENKFSKNSDLDQTYKSVEKSLNSTGPNKQSNNKNLKPNSSSTNISIQITRGSETDITRTGITNTSISLNNPETKLSGSYMVIISLSMAKALDNNKIIENDTKLLLKYLNAQQGFSIKGVIHKDSVLLAQKEGKMIAIKLVIFLFTFRCISLREIRMKIKIIKLAILMYLQNLRV